ncbi:MAG: hypothetical protein G3M70_03480 [Candidatus Nitronauta litoralis]|uniref:Uncharacterized protein n=1 Tax=Candidatus Nitronauta litoralis TaxID=2705533 RepID=A0A7T0BU54_9BACT|nr:MAG: hypothetical protein G3M70_03480 [Candidatus Nitronauta litoralis]
MNWSSEKILQTLDLCAENNTFPMLDNGYVYLAATRMSLFFSKEDWGLSIEVFGFSPRSGLPDLHIYNFSSKLNNRDKASDYSSHEAYENYLKNHPNDEFRFFYPIKMTTG